jgi:hypothetical protein
MTMATPEEKSIRAEIRAVRAEMKSKGIRRMSFMNGGHSPESYRLNARLFVLNSALKRTSPAK